MEKLGGEKFQWKDEQTADGLPPYKETQHESEKKKVCTFVQPIFSSFLFKIDFFKTNK